MARRILISNAHLKDIGGSEIVSVELAEEYAQRGWEVMLYSPIVGEPLLSTISPKVSVTTRMPDLRCGWDIIWDHHGVLMPYLERNMGPMIVANHMSSYVDIEKPKYDVDLPHRIFANSEETAISMGGEYSERAELMQNPAPRYWHRQMAPGTKSMFISKHRPAELEAFIGTLECESVVFNGDRRITRPDMSQAKFVVANGKSVQYALVAGIPVFLYDQFGGPGWLTEENFKQAAAFNFSGRGFKKNICTLNAIGMHELAKPIPAEMVNWRFRLNEWLYYKELV